MRLAVTQFATQSLRSHVDAGLDAAPMRRLPTLAGCRNTVKIVRELAV